MSTGPSTRAGATGRDDGRYPHAEIERAGPEGEGVRAESPATASGHKGAVGEETVPLRPAGERTAEREREERLRVMTTKTGRRPSPPGRSTMLVALAVTAAVALPAVLVLRPGGGTVTGRPGAGVAARSEARSRAPLPQDSPAGPAYRPATEGPRRRRREERRRGRPHRPARRQDRPARDAEPPPARPVPAPEPTEAPEATPDVEVASPPPAPVAEPTPGPEPGSPASPEPTSREESKPSEPPGEAQVEGQFGFER